MTLPAQGRPADARGARPAVLGVRRQGRAQAPADRRRAAGAARHHDACSTRCRAISPTARSTSSPLTTNGSQLAEIRRRARGLRGQAHQRLARHARRRQVPRHHALGRARQGAGRHRCRAGRRHRVKINAVALKGVNEDELPSLVEWAHGARHGLDRHRGDAARRRRRAAARPVPAAVDGARAPRRALHARRDRLPHRRPGALRARARRPAGGSASSRRSPTISANPATACGSPAPARSTCASARRTPPTCARPLRASEGNDLALRGDRRSDHAQAQGPRLRHRPPPQAPGRRPAHERDGRVGKLAGSELKQPLRA